MIFILSFHTLIHLIIYIVVYIEAIIKTFFKNMLVILNNLSIIFILYIFIKKKFISASCHANIILIWLYVKYKKN